MNDHRRKFPAMTVIGPLVVAGLVVLAAILIPIERQRGTSPLMLTPRARIEALNDADLAGPTRSLPTHFGVDLALDFKKSKPFSDQWERFTFFGEDAFAPRRPEKITADLRRKKNLGPDQLAALLDAVLRYRSPSEALAEMDARLAARPRDQQIRHLAAGFAENRRQPRKAVAIEQERFEILAELIGTETDKKAKVALAEKALESIRNLDRLRKAYLLEGQSDPLLRRLIDLCPEHESLLFNYLDRLIESKHYDEAYAFLSAHEGARAKQLGSVLSYKARLREKQGRVDEAVALYNTHPQLFDPAHRLFADLQALLSRNHLVESWRRDLVARTNRALDMPALQRLFRYYGDRGDYRLIEQLLDTAERHARKDGIAPADLEKLADLCMTQGGEPFTSRAMTYRWNLLLLTGDEAEQNRRQAALAQALERAAAPPPLPVGSALPGAQCPLFLDRYPGLAGGVLSLDLNLRGTRERFAQLPDAGRRYENMRLALVLAQPLIDRNIPDAVAAQAAGVAASIHRRLGFADRYADVLTRFVDEHPQSQALPDFLWKLADHHRTKKNLEKELDTYHRLIALAEQRDNRDLGVRARKRIVQRLVEQKQFARVVPFYWERIDARQHEEALLVEFIEFCERNDIFEQAVRAYEIAGKRFDTKKYGDRFAGYLLRKKKQDAFRDLTRTLAQTLNQDDLEDYLNRRVSRYDSWGSSACLFFERMYLTGLSRFPDSRVFLNKLLGFYARFEKKNPEARSRRTELLARYFATDHALGAAFCTELAAQNKLDAAVADLAGTSRLNPIEARFLVEALGFASRFEAQYDVAKKLLAPYPEKHLMDRVAALERSLDFSFHATDPRITAAAADRYDRLAVWYPTQKVHATRAGEVLVEAGKRRAAAKRWETLLEVEPGMPTSYLDLSTLYWDYYMFDHALGVIEQGRVTLKNPLLLGKEKAYIYESMDRIEPAVDEYVRIVCNDAENAWEVEDRLDTLAAGRDLGLKIDKAFDTYLDRSGAKADEVLAYGDYLGRTDRRDRKTEVFKKNLDRFTDERFLTRLSEYFGGMGLADLSEKALERLADASGRATDVLLRILAFYENGEKKKDVVRIGNELIAKNGPDSPRHEQVLERVSDAFWQVGQQSFALDGYRRLADLAPPGPSRDRRLFDYARHCLDAKNESVGAKVLHDLAFRNPGRTTYLAALADHLGQKKDRKQLAALYTEAIQSTRKSSLPGRDKDRIIQQHRRALIKALVQMDRTVEALDQYIEILNRAAPDDEAADEVFRFAQAHGHLERLTGYYTKLAAQSHKDFRWQQILGAYLDRTGLPDKAARQYEKALQNEPQRVELYLRLADALERAGDAKGALNALERRYGLTGSVNDLRRLAEAAYRTGHTDRATGMLDDMVKNESTPSWRLFEVAQIFERHGDANRAAALLGRAMARFSSAPLKMDLRADQLEAYARMVATRSGYRTACVELFSLRDDLRQRQTAASGLARNHLRRSADTVERVIKYAFARAVYDNAAMVQRDAVGQELLARMQKEVTRSALTSQGQSALNARVGFYLTAADSAHLPRLQSRTLQAKATAFAAYKGDSKRQRHYRNAVMAYLDRVRRQGDPARAAAVLAELNFGSDYPKQYYALAARFAYQADNADAQRSALAQLYAVGTNKMFSRDTFEHRRYLDLLAQHDPIALFDLANSTRRAGPFVLWAAYRQKPKLALDALAKRFGNKPASWRLRREIQVLEYLGDVQGAQERYRRLLGLPRTAGGRAEPVDRKVELVEGRWFEWALRYGNLLLDQKDDQAFSFLPAGLEDRPKSAAPYLALASILAEAKRYEEAFIQIDSASLLAPKSQALHEARGDIYLKMGKKREARAQYEKLIASDSAGAGACRTYCRLMKAAGMGDEALARYRRFLRERFSTLGYHQQRDQLDFLLDEMKDEAATALFIRTLVTEADARLALYDLVQNENLLSKKESGWFLESAADLVFASPRFARQAKLRRYRDVVNHALDVADLAMGRRALEVWRRLDPSQDAQRLRQRQAAELALVCDDGPAGSAPLLALTDPCQNRSCFEQLEGIAQRRNRPETARVVRHRSLRFALDRGEASLGDRIDLAALEFADGKADEAGSLLEYVSARAARDDQVLLRVVWTYLKGGRPDRALTHATTCLGFVPHNGEVLFARAVCLACSGDAQKAALELEQVFLPGRLPRSQLPALFDRVLDSLKQAKSLGAFVAALNVAKGEGPALLHARIELDAGRGEAARDALAAWPGQEFSEMHDLLAARAFRQTGDQKAELEVLDRAIGRLWKRKDLMADRFVALQALGQSTRALDSLELFLPTNRYALHKPTDRSSSIGSAKGLPGKLGVADEKADRLLGAVAEALLAIDRPAEARLYLMALRSRMEAGAAAAALDKRIEKLEKRIEALEKKQKPWPVITSEL